MDDDARIERFREMKAQFPDSELPLWSLGTAYEEVGSYEEAIAEFRELVALKPDYTVAWVHLGHCLIEEEEYEDAIAALEEGIRLAEEQGHLAPKKEALFYLQQARDEMDD